MAWSNLRLVSPVLLTLGAGAFGCAARPLAEPTGGDGGLTGGTGTGTAADAGRDARPDRHPITTIVPEETCGDGHLDPDEGEGCDDGNLVNGDGCSSLCQVECDFRCGSCGTPEDCLAPDVCADGVRTAHEACDDGNTVGGDGCAADCKQVEPGWRCPQPGGPCVPVCGDGVIVGGETCDDGNTVGGDGCSAFCIAEPTTLRCGDGIVSGAEECDDGPNNGDPSISPCGAECMFSAPYCGDGAVDTSAGEMCDLGAANGAPGSPCTVSCQIVAR